MMEAMATDTEVATVEMVATEETEAAAAKEGTVTTGVMAVTEVTVAEVTVAEGEGTFFSVEVFTKPTLEVNNMTMTTGSFAKSSLYCIYV